MNWTFLATWLWWRRRWRWITMTIYSTELFQALSRLLRRRLSCFWFIFYYVSAMFIKRDTVIINKTTFTVMWFFSRVCVSEERESRSVCLRGKKKKTPPDSLCLWSGGIDCWRCPDPFLLAGSRSGAPKRHNSAFSRKNLETTINTSPYSTQKLNQPGPHFRIRLNQWSRCTEKHFKPPRVLIVVWP